MRVFVDGPAGYQPFGYQEVLVGSREARKASDGICAVELDPVPQTFSFWVIPTEDAQAIDFGEGDRVVRKAGVGGHPLLVMPVFKVVAAFPVIPNVGIPGEDVHRDFYIALGGRIDVIFAPDIPRLVYKIYPYTYILIFLTPTDTLVTYSYSVFLTSYIPSYFFIIFLTLPIPLP